MGISNTGGRMPFLIASPDDFEDFMIDAEEGQEYRHGWIFHAADDVWDDILVGDKLVKGDHEVYRLQLDHVSGGSLDVSVVSKTREALATFVQDLNLPYPIETNEKVVQIS